MALRRLMLFKVTHFGTNRELQYFNINNLRNVADSQLVTEAVNSSQANKQANIIAVLPQQ